MLILCIKLLLVPSLLAAVTLAARRWGANVAGWLGGFPIVAGPVLLVVTLEQGTRFGALAAEAALAAVGPTMLFVVLYAHLSARLRWWGTLLLAYLGWGSAVALVALAPAGLWVAAALAGSGLTLARVLVRMPPGPSPSPMSHPVELPARMLVGVLLTFASSALAANFGPRLGGFTTVFPLVASVVASFSHALHGRDAALRFLAGMSRGMWSVGAFCLALALLLPRTGAGTAFAVALASTAAFHALLRPPDWRQHVTIIR